MWYRNKKIKKSKITLRCTSDEIENWMFFKASPFFTFSVCKKSVLFVLLLILFVVFFRYLSLRKTIEDLRQGLGRPLVNVPPVVTEVTDSPPLPQPTVPQGQPLPGMVDPSDTESQLQRGKTWRHSRLPWRPLPQVGTLSVELQERSSTLSDILYSLVHSTRQKD